VGINPECLVGEETKIQQIFLSIDRGVISMKETTGQSKAKHTESKRRKGKDKNSFQLSLCGPSRSSKQQYKQK